MEEMQGIAEEVKERKMNELNLDLTGKVALVTGGSRGLGKAIALALAAKGAGIAVCGRKQSNLDAAVEDFRSRGMDVLARAANAGESNQVAELLRAVEDKFGRLDILVNNVGMNILTPSVAEAEELLWDKIIQSNLKGTFLVSKMAVPLMKRGGRAKSSTSVPSRRGKPHGGWESTVSPRQG
jgi:NAD(P)-dependent dehydrogenase (short-subunit alcohol dehydrogenase family)